MKKGLISISTVSIMTGFVGFDLLAIPSHKTTIGLNKIAEAIYTEVYEK